MRRTLGVLLMQLLVGVVVAETLLRLWGLSATYSERIGNGFASYYGQTLPTWYHRWTPGQPYTLSQPEFTYTYRANSLGLRDSEWESEPPAGMRRLILVGDSYVEGDGAPEGQNMPAHMQRLLNDGPTEWQVLNAGVCGLDPFYALTFARTILPDYAHDAALFFVNTSDIGDHIFRGGMERFQPDGIVSFRRGPWWRPAYRFSHLFRAFAHAFGIDGEYLVSGSEMPSLRDAAVREIATALTSLDSLYNAWSVPMAVVIHPGPSEACAEIQSEGLGLMHRLDSLLSLSGVTTVNVIPAMADSMRQRDCKEYAWPINGHYNPKGYLTLARTVLHQVRESYPECLAESPALPKPRTIVTDL